jgi:hypothetical protein
MQTLTKKQKKSYKETTSKEEKKAKDNYSPKQSLVHANDT